MMSIHNCCLSQVTYHVVKNVIFQVQVIKTCLNSFPFLSASCSQLAAPRSSGQGEREVRGENNSEFIWVTSAVLAAPFLFLGNCLAVA